MNVNAMICELNPLHNGHMRLISRMKDDDPDAAILLVMSGNFTQRAGTAIFDKYERARAAIDSGADLVVELPFPFSSSGAEYFARAGVTIAEALGASRLYFGSECGDEARLRELCEITGSDEYRELSEAIRLRDPSLGAAAVREIALSRLVPGYSPDRTETPNDTLAIEYLRNAHIPCVAVKRVETPGASAIREMTAEQAAPYVPEATRRMMSESKRSDNAVLRRLIWENLRLRAIGRGQGEDIAGAALRRDISAFAECGGGLGERLIRLAGKAKSGDEFFAAAATKRYTNARILRASLFALCGVTARDAAAPVGFTVLLGATARGREVLAGRRKESSITLVTKPADMRESAAGNAAWLRQAGLAAFADSICTLTFDPPLDAGDFKRRSPYIK